MHRVLLTLAASAAVLSISPAQGQSVGGAGFSESGAKPAAGWLSGVKVLRPAQRLWILSTCCWYTIPPWAMVAFTSR